jgi:tetratricopeptide (TPR) repeat protein
VLLLLACEGSKTVDLELELAVNLDGKPAPAAKVFVDGSEVGATDDSGHFLMKLSKLPGAEVQVAVEKEANGYRVDPWKDSFVTKLTQPGVIERYEFEPNLKATRFFTLAVTAEGEPLEGAAVKIQGDRVPESAQIGEFEYAYQRAPGKGFKVLVSKQGYQAWQKTVRIQPGDLYTVELEKKKAKPAPQVAAVAPEPKKEQPKKASAPAPAAAAKPNVQQTTLYIGALTEAYGLTHPVPGVSVAAGGRTVGKTSSKGALVYTYKGQPAESVDIKLTSPGLIPDVWEAAVPLKNKRRVQRYFYPAKPASIRVGIFGYVNNSPDKDLSDVIERVEMAIANNLFSYGGFREVPKESLQAMMRQAKLDMETASTKGWKKTPLIRAVDMIIYGSVTADEVGMAIETTVITADGTIILSQINPARKKENVGNTAKLIVRGIVDQFPFEGTVSEASADSCRINLGKADFQIRRGNEFRYMVAETDRLGRLKGYRDAGLLRVIQTDDDSSMLEVVELAEGTQLRVGDRVVRRIYLDERRESEKATATVSVKGGLPPADQPLWGVNVYLNNTWVGTTGSRGTVSIPVSLYEEQDILLSRHGYQQYRDTVSFGEDKEVMEFALEVASALFKVESEPSGAEVSIDGDVIGTTPILEGELVNFGFRKVKLTVGGDFRDWEQVIEFNQPELDRTGNRKIVFLKDYMKIGKRAEAQGNTDAAIAAYASTERENPDYSEARCRLAQLYMDEKNDHDAAIREFENVLSLPENKQIIYKQFAVTYTNLGHAYYEKGNSVIREDKQTAAKNFASAVKNLGIAKQNTRFFPTAHYDEALHDTYYYTALSYHKLYLVTKKRSLITRADRAWQEYFDFFPKSLEGKSNFVAMRSGGQKYWSQIKDLK